ncbi:aspartate/glutamate racemase family protein [Hydrogenophaga sp. PBL-H3]|uniref:aspartate/glutamate racemase family protein n=1 Tax=Hydrogenophaga sp. PBL-H3 TaxID=434010 RepID=UPI001917593F|nr:aspartate/glutamate racemase family protein [Hydrogenophaga sp. PBL-H3]
MTPQLLVINPNTTTSVTDLLARHLGGVLSPAVQVRAVTARFGPPYISDEAGCAVASHGVLDAWLHALHTSDTAPHAVLIGCFGDPGLLALRESSPVPVSGLAEAAFAEATRLGPFAVVTGGERWGPMLQRLAHTLGVGDALAGVHTVAPTGAQLAADPAGARALLAQACRDAHRLWGVQSVIVGGAGLAGMAAQLQPEVNVPLIDSVSAAGHWAQRQLGTTTCIAPHPSPELLAQLHRATPFSRPA